MRIALFADLHGRILLCFKLVARYQRETGKSIDLILQCGDMGVFPNLGRLDKATIKYASYDRTELGFYKAANQDPIMEVVDATWLKEYTKENWQYL